MCLKDPLFAFTELDANWYFMLFLEGIWRPLLVYIQELYGPPISLSGLRAQPLLFSINDLFKSHDDTLSCVHTQTKHSYETCSALHILKRFMPDFSTSMKKGFMTTLLVTIPEDPHHPFWHRQECPQKSEEKWSTQEKLSFKVLRWGETKEEAYDHAIQRAIDIIRYIRTAVSGSPQIPAVKLTMTLTPISCKIIQLGAELCTLWKTTTKLFSRKDGKRFLQAIQEKHDSDEYIVAHPLLQYYKVYP
jgi:hypothetical protein